MFCFDVYFGNLDIPGNKRIRYTLPILNYSVRCVPNYLASLYVSWQQIFYIQLLYIFVLWVIYVFNPLEGPILLTIVFSYNYIITMFSNKTFWKVWYKVFIFIWNVEENLTLQIHIQNIWIYNIHAFGADYYLLRSPL